MQEDNFLSVSSFVDDTVPPIFIENNVNDYVYCNRAFLDFVRTENLQPDSLTPRHPQQLPTQLRGQKRLSQSNSLLDPQPIPKVKIEDYSNVVVTFRRCTIQNEGKKIVGFAGSLETHPQSIFDSLAQNLGLSKREVDVLNFLVRGEPVKNIARLLEISPYTVTDHLKAIYYKMGVRSKGQAVFKALTFANF